MQLSIHTTFTEKLPADPDKINETRQVNGAMFSYVTPKIPSHPKLIHATTEVAQLLGLTKEDCTSEAFTAVFRDKKYWKTPNLLPCVTADINLETGRDNWATVVP